jgi:hypothetical protein
LRGGPAARSISPQSSTDREREKERVERRAVEALAEEAAGRKENDTIPGSSRCKPVGDQASCLLPYSALEDVWLQAQFLELRLQPCDVLGPLRQDEAVAARARETRSDSATWQPCLAFTLCGEEVELRYSPEHLDDLRLMLEASPDDDLGFEEEPET